MADCNNARCLLSTPPGPCKQAKAVQGILSQASIRVGGNFRNMHFEQRKPRFHKYIRVVRGKIPTMLERASKLCVGQCDVFRNVRFEQCYIMKLARPMGSLDSIKCIRVVWTGCKMGRERHCKKRVSKYWNFYEKTPMI